MEATITKLTVYASNNSNGITYDDDTDTLVTTAIGEASNG